MKKLILATITLLPVAASAAGHWTAPSLLTLKAGNWFFWFGQNEPSLKNANPGWSFVIPVGPEDPTACVGADYGCPQVDYVMTLESLPITNSWLRIEAEVVVTSGNPVLWWQMDVGNTCPEPPAVHAILAPNFGSDYGRWWSNPGKIILTPGAGPITVEIPMDPEQWTSVYGQPGTASDEAMAGWLSALQNPYAVGLTFGGGCFFGHGVNVVNGTGTAKFVLKNYQFHD